MAEHVPDLDELKRTIRYHDRGAVDYYGEKSVSFAPDAKLVDWSDDKEVRKAIAQRVYQTRNALIHSKDRNDGRRYKPFGDERPLRKEVPLVRALAEIVIDNAAL